jgi:RNA polymerase sporulation-specific sigma factor
MGLLGDRGIYYIGGTDILPPPLKGEAEQKALEALEQGDEDARQSLVEHNLRLVVYISRRFENTGVNLEDLISIGTIGLIKAVNTYRSDRKIRLATYASRCIENEILMHLRKLRRRGAECSLNDALEQEEEGGVSLMDVLRVEDTMLEDLSSREECQKVRRGVEEVLEGREQMVILRRYGLDGTAPLTQKEVARLCGISRSYVSRIEKRALQKLQEYLEG